MNPYKKINNKKLNISFIKKSFQLQQGQSDCGVACLASVLRYHGSYEYNHRLRILSGTNQHGTNLLGLYHAASKLGFDVDGYEAKSIDDLVKLEAPAILHVIIDPLMQHYVVFYGFKGGCAIIGDPRYGIKIWTRTQLKEYWRSKTLLVLSPNQDFKRKNHHKNFYYFLNFIKADFHILFSAFFLGLIVSVFSLATAIFSQKLIDFLLPNEEIRLLIFSILLLGILLIAQGLIGYIRSQLLLIQSKIFNIRLINKFFTLMLNLPLSFFHSTRSGEMISRMNDTKKIQTTISHLIGNSLVDFMVILVSVSAIFYYSFTAGLVLLFFLPLYLIIVKKMNNSILSLQHLTLGAYAVNEGNYIDTLSGIETIKSNLAASFFEKTANMYYTRYQDFRYNLGKVQISFLFITNTLNILLFVSLIGLSSYFVITDQLMLGALVAILSLSNYIIPSLTNLNSFYIQYQEAKVAFIRMSEFTTMETEGSTGQKEVPRRLFELKLTDVGFNYPGSLDLLKDVNFSLTMGKIKLLTGKNGTGKSTLVHLITKSLIPNYGKIYLDDVDIDQYDLNEYRKILGVVPQNIKIFNNTLLFNLTLTDDPVINNKVDGWCKQHGFDPYFSGFTGGYNAILGEDGIKLSGGQKQILGLARSLFRNPRFLILDEFTSSIDSDTQRFIIDVIQNRKEQAGILIISHDLKMLSIAEELYELSECTIKKKREQLTF